MFRKEKVQKFLKLQKGLFLNVLFFVAAFAAISAFQMRNMLATSDEIAPSLSGPLLRGGSYDVAAAGDRPVLVYFFAPWCTFCAVSSDNLKRLRRLRDDDSLEILTVALAWQDIDEVRNYVERHEINLPVLLGDSSIAEDWRVHAFPTYYVLDSQKRVHRRDLGYSTQFGLWWRTWFVN
ncbi:MAG: TlpA family protein disulfide reductase [Gammaproteobacteria bacterium]|nr:TlpA family protein disulfide reductase [Gammaproteobacteria bacterium]